MRHTYLVALALLPVCAAAAEPDSCRTVRLVDIAWTDTTAVTYTAALLLNHLGYQTRILVHTVPVAFRDLRDGTADAFLGDYEPPMAADSRPYRDSHAIDTLGTILRGAKYSLAVTHDVYAAGLHDIADLPRFGAQLGWAIHGIEPGNDGNRFVSTMIAQNRHGLARFHLEENTQMDMLADLDAAYVAHRPFAFVAWAPHPMNVKYRIDYLTGAEDLFGPDFGDATVHTVSRAGYASACPNAARLLGNIRFDMAGETALMDLVLTTKLEPPRAAATWLRRHRSVLGAWLAGVTTVEGGPGVEAVEGGL